MQEEQVRRPIIKRIQAIIEVKIQDHNLKKVVRLKFTPTFQTFSTSIIKTLKLQMARIMTLTQMLQPELVVSISQAFQLPLPATNSIVNPK